MKKLLFLLLFLPLLAFTQVPQGVGYQGVATDAAGFELINQSISIRASVISASPTGTIEWQETHNTSTDTFGLFNLTIGQGTSTGNGVQTSFADISWGANTHFLKIEMDVNGGTNYSHMGTNQMMSVPYALYAENANIDYDSIATLLSNDSTFINNFNIGGNMVFGNMEDPNINLFYSNPSYNLYYSDTIQAQEDGFLMIFIPNSNNTSSLSVKVSDSSSFLSANTIEYSISETQSYNWSDALTIPIKKNNFYLVNRYFMYNVLLKWLPIVSGGASTSSVDSSYIDSLVQFYSIGNGGGCDWKFPEGFDGDPITHDLNNYNDYVVPSGKKLFILQHYGPAQDARIRIDGIPIKASGNTYSNQYTLANPIIASSGQTISCLSNTQSVFNGIIVEENNDVQSIIHDLNNYNDYVVPSGKKLFILQHYGPAQDARIRIDGIPIKASGNTYSNQYTLANPIIASSGQTISCFSNTQSVFNGYIVDENYFADCGGGGSSSSTIDSSYIDSLVQFYSNGNGGGCNYQFPEGINGEAIYLNLDIGETYTVPTGKRLYVTFFEELIGIDTYYGLNPTNLGFVNTNSMNFMSCEFILNSSQILSSPSNNNNTIMGILIDETLPITALNTEFNNTNPYIVPIGKKLYILNHNMPGSNVSGRHLVNGILYDAIPSIVNSGDTLSRIDSSPTSIYGYLADENYFADCGGGSSSSGGGGSSNDDDNGYGDFANNSQISGHRIFYIANNKIYESDSAFSFENKLYESTSSEYPLNYLKIDHLFVDENNEILYFLETRNVSGNATYVRKTSLKDFNPETVFIIPERINYISDLKVNPITNELHWSIGSNCNSSSSCGLYKYQQGISQLVSGDVDAFCFDSNGDYFYANISGNIYNSQGSNMYSGSWGIEMLEYDNNSSTFFMAQGGSDYVWDSQGNTIYDSNGYSITDIDIDEQTQRILIAGGYSISIIDYNGLNHSILEIRGGSSYYITFIE